tara:strand:- start:2758 stop:4380 length:1623 start_codon:yes stop_codon:yes gene_type:complete
MRKNIFYIFFIISVLYSSAIQIDGQFSDWNADSSIYYYEDTISDTNGADLLNLSVTNDENFLFIKIKLDREIDLLDDYTNQSEIIIQIDADNNPNTGYSIGGIGSEYGIRCLEKYVYDNTYPGNNTEPLSFVQFRALPSITSDEFEIAIGRYPLGESIFNDTIAIIIKENHSNDFIPNQGEIITFTFDDSYHEPVQLFEINKENSDLLRVMSYNTLQNGLNDSNRIDRFIRIINSINPQIIGFNETGGTSEQDVYNVLEASLGGIWYVLKHYPENITASRYPIVGIWDVHSKIQATLIDLDDEIYDSYMLFIVGHLSCCNSDSARQQQVDRVIQFILDAKTPGGQITISQNTPIVFLGDMNLVGDSQQYYTIIHGDIQDTENYGEGGFPDWDDSELEDVICRQTDKRMAYTWRHDNSSYPPGRLDFIFYTNSVMSVSKSFTLQTEVMNNERLENYGLLWDDTKIASDHFPVVVDFNLSSNQDCNLNGDINNDQIINIVDIIAMVDYILIPNNDSLDCLDINNDGYINVVDIVALVDIILN